MRRNRDERNRQHTRSLAARLKAVSPDLERHALEALVLESFRAGHLSTAEVSTVLGFATLDETDGFLKAHALFEPYSMEDLARERRILDELNL